MTQGQSLSRLPGTSKRTDGTADSLSRDMSALEHLAIDADGHMHLLAREHAMRELRIVETGRSRIAKSSRWPVHSTRSSTSGKPSAISSALSPPASADLHGPTTASTCCGRLK
jgi:hypothetical protein